MAKGPQNLPKVVNLEEIQHEGIFIKNLPYKVTEEEIRSFFMSCGKVLKVNMVYAGGKFLGHCFVSFDDVNSVQKALLLSGHPMNGRFLKIENMSFENFKKIKKSLLIKREKDQNNKKLYEEKMLPGKAKNSKNNELSIDAEFSTDSGPISSEKSDKNEISAESLSNSGTPKTKLLKTTDSQDAKKNQQTETTEDSS